MPSTCPWTVGPMLFIRICRTDMGEGQKNLQGHRPGALEFLRERRLAPNRMGLLRRPPRRILPLMQLPVHLTQRICLIQSGSQWKLWPHLLVFDMLLGIFWEKSLLSKGYKCPLILGEMCLQIRVRTPSSVSFQLSEPVKALL